MCQRNTSTHRYQSMGAATSPCRCYSGIAARHTPPAPHAAPPTPHATPPAPHLSSSSMPRCSTTTHRPSSPLHSTSSGPPSETHPTAFYPTHSTPGGAHAGPTRPPYSCSRRTAARHAAAAPTPARRTKRIDAQTNTRVARLPTKKGHDRPSPAPAGLTRARGGRGAKTGGKPHARCATHARR